MKLFLATFRLDVTRYMGDKKRGERDSRLIWAESEKEAIEKLEKALVPPYSPGDDGYWLENIEINEAIM